MLKSIAIIILSVLVIGIAKNHFHNRCEEKGGQVIESIYLSGDKCLMAAL